MSATTLYCSDKNLRPCPFCGSEARIAARETRRGFMAFITCTFCEAQTRPFAVKCFDPETFDDDGFDRAIARWQHRQQGTVTGNG